MSRPACQRVSPPTCPAPTVQTDRAVWPYCAAARRMSSIIMSEDGGKGWDKLEWRRRLETFDHDDEPVVASGARGEVDSIW